MVIILQSSASMDVPGRRMQELQGFVNEGQDTRKARLLEIDSITGRTL
jgi:hypothetical protein